MRSLIDIKVGGMISYSKPMKYLWLLPPAIKKSANMLLTLLLWTILAVKTSASPAAAARTLFLQCDGGSENVNR
jgi:hypothetical protein